ncbi:MAG: hypothetical protein JSV91_12565 [Phycisphaerales bacterium]|nr:MAG: hypothetical protein JSV91_12565 [Phycisphaerales bacterium]
MRPLITTIAWGVFCACSWTWCIGMFLPKLMIDRFGWWGFLVFAVPNVIGCAGFGYVLAKRQRSEETVQRHGGSMVVFSLIAIAFHMLFITYLFAELLPRADVERWLGSWEGLAAVRGNAAVICAAVVWGAGLILSFLGDRAWLVVSGLVYAFSLAAFAAIGLGEWEWLGAVGRSQLSELAYLAPVICLGFLLCPYLDLTFHRALQQSPSRHAFGVLGITFAVMILFTCFLWFSPTMMAIGVGHILAQSIFTVGAHLRELRLAPAIRGRGVRVVLSLLPLAISPLVPLVRLFFTTEQVPGEDLYIRFLVFYGLIFPAYVLMFIGPGRPIRLNRAALLACVAAVVVFAPLFEAGFVHQRGWLLLLPAAAALAWLGARLTPAKS